MDGQTMIELANMIVEGVKGISTNATMEAANKAFYASLASGAISFLALLINIYLTNQQIKRDASKTYTQLMVDEKFKNLQDLKKAMSDLVGISYDLLRRGYIIAKGDGGPRQEEYKEYNKLARVEINKLASIIKFRLDIPSHNDFCESLNEFIDELYKIAPTLTKVEDDQYEKQINKLFIEFETKCRTVIEIEMQEVKNIAKQTYIK
jgi:hypothetical protein